MHVVGIIAEFNPFHDGHRFLIEQVKKALQPDGIIVIMSGDFVQRGQPAIFDKFSRTRMALKQGADLVLELPVSACLSSAQGFAQKAVSILNHTGIVTTLAFGMEAGVQIPVNSSELTRRLLHTADFFNNEPKEYQLLLQEFLRKGYSFPRARETAFKQYQNTTASTDTSFFLQTPNNILALEYACAILRLQSPITLFPIARTSGISAHKIRKQLQQEQAEGIFLDDYSLPFQWQFAGIDKKPDFPDFSEELYHRLLRINQPQMSLSDVILHCKTKQYTHSRISRCFLRFLLDIREQPSDYARILGFRKSHAFLIRALKETTCIPVIDKLYSSQKHLTSAQKQDLQQDILAHQKYRSVARQKYPDWQIASDFESGMIIQQDS